MADPLVSCLMVTQQGRLEMFKHAVGDYLRQTYPNRELVIVTSDAPAAMAPAFEFIRELGNPSIQFHQLAHLDGKQQPLGAMRNATNDLAAGTLCCTWDDDDRHHPDRLKTHYDTIVAQKVDGSYLNEQLHFFPQDQALYWTDWRQRRSPGILLYRRSPVRYPVEGERAHRGEDTDFITKLCSSGQKIVKVAGGGQLYLRYFHGKNTWHYAHHLHVAKSGSLNGEQLTTRRHVIAQTLKLFQVPGPVHVRDRTRIVFTYNG